MPTVADRTELPNILLLTAHDMGRFLGCYGRQAHTPVLDDFAASGARFDNAFCPTPHCCPARASIHTGLLPHNNGMFGHVGTHKNWTGWEIHGGIRTVPQYLHDLGYESHTTGTHAASTDRRLGYQHVHDAEGSNARAVADCIEDVLDEQIDEERPFFLAAAPNNAHRPYSRRENGFKQSPIPGYDGPTADAVEVPEPVQDHPEIRCVLADMYEDIYELDYAFGQILDSLAKRGIKEETVVVFVADHGINVPRGKGTGFDLGLETSLLVDGPGVRSSVHEELVSHVDILPTILDFVGGKTPRGIDGTSFAPLLDGDGQFSSRDGLFFEMTWYEGYRPIRGIRTERYKYLRNLWPGGHHPALRTPGNPTLPNVDRDGVPNAENLEPMPEEELYDLHDDPVELNNRVGDDYEDPSHEREFERLHDRLVEKLYADDDPIVDGPVTPVDQVFDVQP